MLNTPPQNTTHGLEKPDAENIPEGFRVVEEGEVIPPGYETRENNTTGKSITNAPKMAPKSFPEPQVLTAKIDPKQKAEQPKTAFSFSNPSVQHQHNSLPTKGEAQAPQADPPGAPGSAASHAAPGASATTDERLAKVDAALAAEAKDPNSYGYDDYKDTAEMFIEMWEGGMQFAALLIDKNGAPSAYGFLKEKKDKLIEMGIKVSRKRNWVLPPEYSFFGTLIPATTRVILKANDNRKEYMKKKRAAEAMNVLEEKVKGGPNKGAARTRGPGRPRKA